MNSTDPITPEQLEAEYEIVAGQVLARIAEFHARYGSGGTLYLAYQDAATLFRTPERSGIPPREWNGPLTGISSMFGLPVRIKVDPVSDRLTPPRVA
jgi:hypothetical protein